MDHVYDVIIVGAGMIGSAAARYASMYKGLKVCIIGPDEPQMKRDFNNRDIYGAYYDEARLTNTTQRHPVWGKLASRSIEQYRIIEKQSGIDLYTAIGSMIIGTKDGQYVTSCIKSAEQSGVFAQVLNPDQSIQKFPYINLRQQEQGVYQQTAGYVNPRKLVSAELLLAKRNNCDVIRDIVAKIIHPAIDSELFKLHTDLGNIFYTRKVLLAPGAFVEARQLLPGGLKPDLQLITQCVIYAEVSDNDLKKMLNMPSITRHLDDGGNRDCYILPPVKYPDGKYYIKLGHGFQFDNFIDPSKIADWYRQDVPPHIKQSLVNILHDVFPDFKPLSIHTDTCVTTRTRDRSLCVDLITPRLGVAIGGNGYAAKSCDNIGKVAADMIIASKWNSDLPKDWFKLDTVVSKL